jgi:hypothetical protein
MVENAERRLLYPSNETDRAALACLLRLRSEGKSLDEIVAGLAVETGLTLAPMTLDRVLQQVAGPVPRAEGGDPEYFSGYLGGG